MPKEKLLFYSVVNKATMVTSVTGLPTLVKAGTSVSAQFNTSENAKCTLKVIIVLILVMLI